MIEMLSHRSVAQVPPPKNAYSRLLDRVAQPTCGKPKGNRELTVSPKDDSFEVWIKLSRQKATQS